MQLAHQCAIYCTTTNTCVVLQHLLYTIRSEYEEVKDRRHLGQATNTSQTPRTGAQCNGAIQSLTIALNTITSLPSYPWPGVHLHRPIASFITRSHPITCTNALPEEPETLIVTPRPTHLPFSLNIELAHLTPNRWSAEADFSERARS
jgi:hypothetical protein